MCRGSQNRRKKSLERENKDCGEVSVQNSNVKGDHHNRSENYDKEVADNACCMMNQLSNKLFVVVSYS